MIFSRVRHIKTIYFSKLISVTCLVVITTLNGHDLSKSPPQTCMRPLTRIIIIAMAIHLLWHSREHLNKITLLAYYVKSTLAVAIRLHAQFMSYGLAVQGVTA